MRFRFYQHLRVQLVAAALLPMLLVGGAISVPLIGVQQAQVLDQARLRARQAGQTAATIFAERVAFAQLLARLLSDQPVLAQQLTPDSRSALQAFVQQTRADTLFDLVTIVDRRGAVLAQDGNRALWRPATLVPTLSFWGAPGAGLIVQVAAPILGAGTSGQLIGSFAVGEAFARAIREQTDLDQSILFGDTLVATSAAGRAQDPRGFAQPELAGQVLRREQSGSVEFNIGTTPYLAHYTPLANAGQVIGAVEVLVPLLPVRAAQTQVLLTVLALSLVAMCGAVVLGWLLARQIGAPIRRLARAADAIGAGVLDEPVAQQGPAEVRQLGLAIERMRHSLAQTHSALQAEKTRYANIIESVEESVIALDRHTRVTSLNRSAELLLGLSRDQARGLPLGDVVRLRQDAVLRLTDIPPLGAAPLAIRTPDARTLTVSATRSQVVGDSADAPDEHVVVLRDISAETEINQLKDAFLANITHEFRTPLASAIASLEILREDHGALTAAERQQMLTAVHLGVQRLDTLIQNLLDSASLQAGYFRVDPDVSRIGPLIDEAVELMTPLVQQRDQRITVQRLDAPPVLADERRVVQVLVNVLSNASKFGPRGDTLEIRVAATDEELAVSVTDHGPGIAAPRQERLFERFLRPGTATVQAQGAGLGLAIVKAIVERHGGRVLVNSTENGTTIGFTLRRADLPDDRR